MRMRSLLDHRLVRFLFFGGTAAALNVLLMYLFVNQLGWNTRLGRNMANVVSVELSLLYSYIVYRLFVRKPNETQQFTEPLLSQLLRYHGSAGTAIVFRWIALFPILDWLGLHYSLNTVVGALGSCVINYALAGRYVFHSESIGG